MRVEKNFILNSENIYPIQINRSDNGNVMWFGRISYYTFQCETIRIYRPILDYIIVIVAKQNTSVFSIGLACLHVYIGRFI